MKHKTSELDGVLLDRAVALCEPLPDGGQWTIRADMWSWATPVGRLVVICADDYWPRVQAMQRSARRFAPSADWAHGGPIIERERISLDAHPDSDPAQPWLAAIGRDYHYGPMALIAAMRAYVASKFGDEVDIPET